MGIVWTSFPDFGLNCSKVAWVGTEISEMKDQRHSGQVVRRSSSRSRYTLYYGARKGIWPRKVQCHWSSCQWQKSTRVCRNQGLYICFLFRINQQMTYRLNGNIRRGFLFPSLKEVKLEDTTKRQRHYFHLFSFLHHWSPRWCQLHTLFP